MANVNVYCLFHQLMQNIFVNYIVLIHNHSNTVRLRLILALQHCQR